MDPLSVHCLICSTIGIDCSISIRIMLSCRRREPAQHISISVLHLAFKVPPSSITTPYFFNLDSVFKASTCQILQYIMLFKCPLFNTFQLNNILLQVYVQYGCSWCKWDFWKPKEIPSKLRLKQTLQTLEYSLGYWYLNQLMFIWYICHQGIWLQDLITIIYTNISSVSCNAVWNNNIPFLITRRFLSMAKKKMISSNCINKGCHIHFVMRSLTAEFWPFLEGLWKERIDIADKPGV